MKRLMIALSFTPFFLLATPFMIVWNPLTTLIPHSVHQPFTPLIWPGIVVVSAGSVTIVSRLKSTWPKQRFTVIFNLVVTVLALLMTLLAIGFALDPT